MQALLRSILSMCRLADVWVTWDRQVLALTAAALWAQLCCPAISELPLSAVQGIDLDAALMENNIDPEHFMGTWECSSLIASTLLSHIQ